MGLNSIILPLDDLEGTEPDHNLMFVKLDCWSITWRDSFIIGSVHGWNSKLLEYYMVRISNVGILHGCISQDVIISPFGELDNSIIEVLSDRRITWW